MANYLNTLEGDWTAYFHGAPSMYVSFPTLEFLVQTVDPHSTLLDVTEPEVPAIVTNSPNIVFIFVPERQGDVSLVQAAFPSGELTAFQGEYANPLFFAYEVNLGN